MKWTGVTKEMLFVIEPASEVNEVNVAKRSSYEWLWALFSAFVCPLLFMRVLCCLWLPSLMNDFGLFFPVLFVRFCLSAFVCPFYVAYGFGTLWKTLGFFVVSDPRNSYYWHELYKKRYELVRFGTNWYELVRIGTNWYEFYVIIEVYLKSMVLNNM